ncbi:MAG: transposase [Bacteroidetes bacterium]|nr:transposase [Bacteroidota bacterium]
MNPNYGNTVKQARDLFTTWNRININVNFQIRRYNHLKGIRTDSKGYDKKTYRSSETDCKNCPLRKSCAGEKTKFKKLDDTVDKPYYDRMHERMQTEYAKTMVRIRSKTVEPVLGTLLNFMGMRRVNTRGINKANKHVLMASLCYNLKKYLKFIRLSCATVTLVMGMPFFFCSPIVVFVWVNCMHCPLI